MPLYMLEVIEVASSELKQGTHQFVKIQASTDRKLVDVEPTPPALTALYEKLLPPFLTKHNFHPAFKAKLEAIVYVLNGIITAIHQNQISLALDLIKDGQKLIESSYKTDNPTSDKSVDDLLEENRQTLEALHKNLQTLKSRYENNPVQNTKEGLAHTPKNQTSQGNKNSSNTKNNSVFSIVTSLLPTKKVSTPPSVRVSKLETSSNAKRNGQIDTTVTEPLTSEETNAGIQIKANAKWSPKNSQDIEFKALYQAKIFPLTLANHIFSATLKNEINSLIPILNNIIISIEKKEFSDALDSTIEKGINIAKNAFEKVKTDFEALEKDYDAVDLLQQNLHSLQRYNKGRIEKNKKTFHHTPNSKSAPKVEGDSVSVTPPQPTEEVLFKSNKTDAGIKIQIAKRIDAILQNSAEFSFFYEKIFISSSPNLSQHSFSFAIENEVNALTTALNKLMNSIHQKDYSKALPQIQAAIKATESVIQKEKNDLNTEMATRLEKDKEILSQRLENLKILKQYCENKNLEIGSSLYNSFNFLIRSEAKEHDFYYEALFSLAEFESQLESAAAKRIAEEKKKLFPSLKILPTDVELTLQNQFTTLKTELKRAWFQYLLLPLDSDTQQNLIDHKAKLLSFFNPKIAEQLGSRLNKAVMLMLLVTLAFGVFYGYLLLGSTLGAGYAATASITQIGAIFKLGFAAVHQFVYSFDATLGTTAIILKALPHMVFALTWLIVTPIFAHIESKQWQNKEIQLANLKETKEQEKLKTEANSHAFFKPLDTAIEKIGLHNIMRNDYRKEIEPNLNLRASRRQPQDPPVDDADIEALKARSLNHTKPAEPPANPPSQPIAPKTS